ncbi:MAG: hypothetical protein IH621_16750 [Krumholzibacteria bacterium]|nr:hypothetical protein [Candidatus Krumholzibacteria bacterium]
MTPPRRHKHRYCGVLAPIANLRQAATASAGSAGSMLQVLEGARRRMALPAAASAPDPPPDEPRSDSIFESPPLECQHCGQPMRIIAFVLDPGWE